MNSENQKNSAAFGSAKIVYLLFMASLLNGITAVIGVIIAYVYRDEGPDWLRSHFQFQIRTFWIGALYMLLGFISVPILIGFLVLLFCAVWLLIRCIKGFKTLEQRVEHPAVESWMF